MYHSTIVITPPEETATRSPKKRWGWHQDSGRLNLEMEGNPRPRISLKVGFFLTDTTQADRANLYMVPGSHLRNETQFPSDGVSNPEGAVPLLVPAGAAVIFDRRIWHCPSPNHSEITRKLLLYGYSYRWIRPRDNMTVSPVHGPLQSHPPATAGRHHGLVRILFPQRRRRALEDLARRTPGRGGRVSLK
jgi:ectoine hydroxylase-related dioxygenase (phytanoyl-CoA dioxygenase family)